MINSTTEEPLAGDIADAMRELDLALRRRGYMSVAQADATVRDLDPHEPDYASATAFPAVHALLRLGASVPDEDLPLEVAAALHRFVDLGLAHDTPSGLNLKGLALYFTTGIWLFADIAKPWPSLYFGHDSLALVSQLPFRPRRAIDFCSGPGVQALHMALRGAEVEAVEINPIAARLSQTNAALNGLSDRIHVNCGPVAEAEFEGQFDAIVANPPLLPVVGVDYPLIGDGGPDGLRVTRDVVHAMARYLSEDGQGVTLGLCTANDDAPLAWNEFESLAVSRGLVMRWVTVGKSPLTGGRWSELLVRTSMGFGGASPTEQRERTAKVNAQFEALGGTQVWAYYLSVHRSDRPGIEHIDLSAVRPSAELRWFA